MGHSRKRHIEAAEVYAPASYVPFSPRVRVARGFNLVTRSGIVVTNPSLAWKSSYQYPLDMFLETWAVAVGSFFRHGAAEAPVEKDKPIAIVHTAWTLTYYHLITETLPRILRLKQFYPQAIPIFPYKEYSNHSEILRAIGVEEFWTFPGGKNLIGRDILISECVPRHATMEPEFLKMVRDRILDHYKLEQGSPSKILYVSRRNATCRRVINEAEVLEALRPYSPEVIIFEELSFRQQVELMRSAKLLIGPHGAGFTNMLFMPEGGAVFEFVPGRRSRADFNRVLNCNKADPCFIRLADLLNHKHGHFVSDSNARPDTSTHYADFIVDIPRMLTQLHAFVASTNGLDSHARRQVNAGSTGG